MLGVSYVVTASSMMQGYVFLTVNKIHQWLCDSKINGKPHVTLLDGSIVGSNELKIDCAWLTSPGLVHPGPLKGQMYPT